MTRSSGRSSGVRLELSHEAAADLAEIADFTILTWGEQAADDYVDGVLALFSDVERIAHAASVEHRVLKRLTYRSHFIYFEAFADRVVIARVLHRRRDTFRHLP